jgi:ATP-dependent DNA helicase RecG
VSNRFCVLLHDEKISEDAKKRLKIMESSNDGFFIAEEDLRLRGSGEITGTVQSGFQNGFTFANLYTDQQLLETAREDAVDILESFSEDDIEKLLHKKNQSFILA